MAEIVYVLTNPAMPNYVKIGRTSDLEQRLRQLDNTSTPLPFECVYAVEVEDSVQAERLLHDGLADVRTRKTREFFEIDAQRVISLLQLSGGKNVTPRHDIVEDESAQNALDKARVIRERFNFEMVNIPVGTSLNYLRDEAITCEVLSKTKIMFRGEETSLSAAAMTLNEEVMGYKWTTIAGPMNWVYEDETLAERRKRMELEE